VHDEIIALIEKPEAQALSESMHRIMSNPPAWAKGLPLAVSGYVSERYGKK
jgi:hypothetical protein